MSPSIVLYETDALHQNMVVSLLKSTGTQVHCTSTAQEFLDTLREVRPEMSLLGIQDVEHDLALAEAKNEDSELASIPCILFVPSHHPIDSNTLKALNIQHALVRPFDAGQLYELLQPYIPIAQLDSPETAYLEASSFEGSPQGSEEMISLLESAPAPTDLGPKVPEVDFSEDLFETAGVDISPQEETSSDAIDAALETHLESEPIPPMEPAVLDMAMDETPPQTTDVIDAAHFEPIPLKPAARPVNKPSPQRVTQPKKVEPETHIEEPLHHLDETLFETQLEVELPSQLDQTLLSDSSTPSLINEPTKPDNIDEWLLEPEFEANELQLPQLDTQVLWDNTSTSDSPETQEAITPSVEFDTSSAPIEETPNIDETEEIIDEIDASLDKPEKDPFEELLEEDLEEEDLETLLDETEEDIEEEDLEALLDETEEDIEEEDLEALLDETEEDIEEEDLEALLNETEEDRQENTKEDDLDALLEAEAVAPSSEEEAPTSDTGEDSQEDRYADYIDAATFEAASTAEESAFEELLEEDLPEETPTHDPFEALLEENSTEPEEEETLEQLLEEDSTESEEEDSLALLEEEEEEEKQEETLEELLEDKIEEELEEELEELFEEDPDGLEEEEEEESFDLLLEDTPMEEEFDELLEDDASEEENAQPIEFFDENSANTETQEEIPDELFDEEDGSLDELFEEGSTEISKQEEEALSELFDEEASEPEEVVTEEVLSELFDKEASEPEEVVTKKEEATTIDYIDPILKSQIYEQDLASLTEGWYQPSEDSDKKKANISIATPPEAQSEPEESLSVSTDLWTEETPPDETFDEFQLDDTELIVEEEEDLDDVLLDPEEEEFFEENEENLDDFFLEEEGTEDEHFDVLLEEEEDNSDAFEEELLTEDILEDNQELELDTEDEHFDVLLEEEEDNSDAFEEELLTEDIPEDSQELELDTEDEHFDMLLEEEEDNSDAFEEELLTEDILEDNQELELDTEDEHFDMLLEEEEDNSDAFEEELLTEDILEDNQELELDTEDEHFDMLLEEEEDNSDAFEEELLTEDIEESSQEIEAVIEPEPEPEQDTFFEGLEGVLNINQSNYLQLVADITSEEDLLEFDDIDDHAFLFRKSSTTLEKEEAAPKDKEHVPHVMPALETYPQEADPVLVLDKDAMPPISGARVTLSMQGERIPENLPPTTSEAVIEECEPAEDSIVTAVKHALDSFVPSVIEELKKTFKPENP